MLTQQLFVRARSTQAQSCARNARRAAHRTSNQLISYSNGMHLFSYLCSALLFSSLLFSSHGNPFTLFTKRQLKEVSAKPFTLLHQTTTEFLSFQTSFLPSFLPSFLSFLSSSLPLFLSSSSSSFPFLSFLFFLIVS